MPKYVSVLCCLLIFLLFFTACAPEKPKKEVVLYQQYCASCHMAPKIDELPRDIWKNSVLPDMAARMEIEEMYQDPLEVKPGFRPKISLQDWIAVQNYIVDQAPENLTDITLPQATTLEQFDQTTLAVGTKNGALITYLEYNKQNSELYLGELSGTLYAYDFDGNQAKILHEGKTPITWYNPKDSIDFVTEVGILDPSELERGQIISKKGDKTNPLALGFYRPVHNLVEDLNGDGRLEMVVSEFGDETGRLSLLVQNDTLGYDKKVLLNQPGCIRTLAKDMDKDGLTDLITITSQGNESITILYQKEGLRFEAEKVLQFRSVYGSSWFELIDYNGDGFDDLVTVNGDNADKSYVQKPYHGMRIHLNDGQNNFTETYFYPMNGATRVVANDFDQDGDVDFGLISTFPDYERDANRSFVYLENVNAAQYEFQTKLLEDPNAGRWFLMDAADVDNDGDTDMVLSSFTYVFTPVPEALSKRWAESNVDLMILENKLK